MAPKVDPWYPPHRAMIFSFPVAMRASLIAPSFASAPLVEKYDFVMSPGVISAKSFASRALGSVAKEDATFSIVLACREMASAMRSSACPRLLNTN